MKKNGLLLMSAAILMAGCTANDDLVHGVTSLENPTNQAINFNMKTAAVTRSTLSGQSAADKLNGEFVVYGTKTGTATTVAFNNYVVKHDVTTNNSVGTDYTAGTTSTNTSGWEYVGVKQYEVAKVSPTTPSGNSQTVKYWDYSASTYQFTAFSAKKLLSGTPADGAPFVSVNTTAAVTGNDGSETSAATPQATGYTLNIPANADLDSIFFSDRVTVNKADGDYGKPVVLTFRNFGARVRVGFYETVPGYSVTIDKFYTDDDASAVVTDFTKMNKAENDATFKASLENINKTTANPISVSYYESGDNANQVKLATSSATHLYTLTLGGGLKGATLGKTADKATYTETTTSGETTTNSNGYTTVYPMPENTSSMLIKCDYTLTADDGSGETIKVKNARVIVPNQYVQWKSNYAYTYLFKISDKSNGTTGNYTPGGGGSGSGESGDQEKSDKEGLYPITFDAVVVESTDYQQENITTVATNSVTSYALKSNVTANGEYKAGTDIYFVDTKADGTVIAPKSVASEVAGSAQVYKLTSTKIKEPTEADVIAQLTGLDNGLTMTAETEDGKKATVVGEVPSADGTKITMKGTNSDSESSKDAAVKFAIPAITSENASPEYYAYVYCGTKYVAPSYKKTEDESFNGRTTYYFEANGTTSGSDTKKVYYVASNITSANFAEFKDRLYVVDQAGTPGVYDVKVVKVIK